MTVCRRRFLTDLACIGGTLLLAAGLATLSPSLPWDAPNPWHLAPWVRAGR